MKQFYPTGSPMRYWTLPLFLVLFLFINSLTTHAQGCAGGRTQTPGGWGAPANGNNPGVYRDLHFATSFPNGLTIGCGSNTITLTSAAAVQNYLPCGGQAKKINGTFTNPSCQKNVLSGHLIAATLSVTFDEDDANFGSSPFALGSLIIASGPFQGMTVNEVLAIANQVIGNCSSAYTVQQMNTVLTSINQNYVDGSANLGFLLCPSECVDNEDPTVEGETEITVECGQPIPNVPPVFQDNEDSDLTIQFAQSIEVLECVTVITRVWRAEDDCANETVFTQVITQVDTTAPTLSEYPANLFIDCADEAPAAPAITASDLCDSDVSVSYQQSLGNGGFSGCSLITPSNSLTDPTWSMVVFETPSGTIYFNTVYAVFNEIGNNLNVSGQLVDINNPNGGFDLVLNLENGLDWNAWSNQAFPTNYKDDFNLAGNNYLDWTYFLVGAGSQIVGWGDYAGSVITLTHAPSNLYYGFQRGIAANNVNGAYGLGGWVYFDGTFVQNGESYTIDSAGDFAFDYECCFEPPLIRTWTATDCSNNTTTHTQVITFVGGYEE